MAEGEEEEVGGGGGAWCRRGRGLVGESLPCRTGLVGEWRPWRLLLALELPPAWEWWC